MTSGLKPVLDYRRMAPPVRLPRYLGLRAPTRRPVNWLFVTIMLGMLSLAVVVMIMSLD